MDDGKFAGVKENYETLQDSLEVIYDLFISSSYELNTPMMYFVWESLIFTVESIVVMGNDRTQLIQIY